MEGHQLRVVEEKSQLDIKLMALYEFMEGEQFHVLCDEAERIRLIKQSNAMQDYSDILGDRIENFK